MMLKRMGRHSWGYLDIAPDRAGAARSAAVVHLTPAGKQAQQIWAPVADVILTRWRVRFGASAVDGLGSDLSSLIDALGVALPGFMPITELGGGWGVRSPSARAHGAGSGAGAPLPALLSGLPLAFGAELECRSGMSPVLSANVIRVLGDAGVPVRRLSALTGLASMGVQNSLSALSRRGSVDIGPDPAGGRARLAALTADGARARAAYEVGVAEIEQGCETRCGRQAVRAVREALEVLVGSGASPDSPLLAGLTPYPDGWRAQVPALRTLPHYPFVSHRGGFPDGS
jgi:DNA-binding MarR family transcriptional regulator